MTGLEITRSGRINFVLMFIMTNLKSIRPLS